jgi:hypothetical protein
MTAGLYTPAFHSVWSIVCAYALGGLPYHSSPMNHNSWICRHNRPISAHSEGVRSLLCFRLRSRQVNAGQRRNAVRFSLSHFSPQAHNPESDWAGDCDQVILEKCGLVKAIRSSVHERRCTMQAHDKPHDELLLMNRKSNWNRTELLTDRFLRGLTQRIGRLFSANRK